MDRKYDFNDLVLQQAKQSDILSRKEIDFTYEGNLPLFVSPMDTVINIDNYHLFYNKGFNICLPRGLANKSTHLKKRLKDSTMVFESFGLDDFQENVLDDHPNAISNFVLIDIANGNMSILVKLIKEFKQKFPDKKIMVGNIANPEVYTVLSEAGADYIRVGIGNGAGCLTTKQTGIGYPMASLIKECYNESAKLDDPAKIVADGGFKEYADIIKALALGADYVMLGSILNKTIESAGNNYWHKIPISQSIASKLYNGGFKVTKKFRGMSTKEVQRTWGKAYLKTSEGVVRYRPVEYTIKKWTTNFSDYLRSAMSYAGARDLSKFVGLVKYNLISDNSYIRFDK